jgi:hypothetical protein
MAAYGCDAVINFCCERRPLTIIPRCSAKLGEKKEEGGLSKLLILNIVQTVGCHYEARRRSLHRK